MRVTGGELVGRRFVAPRGSAVRPSSDRVRESLFARLGDLRGARVLDLYAGSGSLGIEALSRGAARGVFVERAGACVARLRGNLHTLGLAPRGRVLQGDVRRILGRLAAEGPRFDLVLADPPYASDEGAWLLETLPATGLLARGGLLILEASRRQRPPPCPGLRLADERRYGDTLVLRYEEEDPEPGPASPGDE